MDRIVRIVTKNLVSRLPSEKEFIRLDYLRSLDIPDFIVERVKVEMQRNLEDSIVLPYTEWADLKNNRVMNAWDRFIEVIREESRMPYAYAPSVIESAVSDSLDMLLQPRKRIPEILFGSDKALDRETLEERSEMVVVYKHLSLAPVKYLYRKNLEALTFEQCKKVISTVDERLVSRYNALNWAHLLEPLFELLGDTIDTNLLRIFFEDKKRPAIAHTFDKMNSSINRSGLIEVLSSPEILDDSDMDEGKSALYQNEDPVIEKKNEKESEFGLDLSRFQQESEKESSDEPLYSRFVFDEKATASKESAEDAEEEEEDQMRRSFNAMFAELEQYKFKEEQGQAKKSSDEEKLQEKQAADDEYLQKSGSTDEYSGTADQSGTEEENSEKPAVVSEDKIVSGLDSTAEGKAAEEPAVSDKKKDENEDESILSETEPPDDSEKSLWQNFASEEIDIPDEVEEKGTIVDFASLEEKEEDEAYSTGDDEEKVRDRNSTSIPDENGEGQNHSHKLIQWLGDDADRFIDELFKGSDSAFEEAMDSIAECDDWKSATRFIEKEVFARNLIDMYDETAVDFTDRLHTYFIEFKSSKASS